MIFMNDKEGCSMYVKMQKEQYKHYTKSYEDAKNLCVGNFDAHEAYPYEKYLLEKYHGRSDYALDFGCGIGRMMKRMLDIFTYVDGADLMQENLDYAKRYLSGENQIKASRYNLFKTSGLDCKIIPAHRYDFIYSTICLQHIAVHKIRYDICCDLYHLLEEKGQCCFQMGFGWDNGVHWFDDKYTAQSTNAGLDVSVPDAKYLPVIESDFKRIGFKKVEFTVKESPHEYLKNYHPYWLFIHLWKQS